MVNSQRDELFAEDFKEEPYWWLGAPRPEDVPESPPKRADVVVVGSGFTGLSAALTLARAGRDVVILEAGVPGYGASSRNAGFVGKTLKHSFGSLLQTKGEAYAVRVYREMQSAFDCVTGLIEREQIQCHYEPCGRFMAVHSPAQYEAMARELELKRRYLNEESEMIPARDQHREIGSDTYQGGAVVPDLGSLHPGLYHLGLLDRVQAAGARIMPRTAMQFVQRNGGEFNVSTDRGTLMTRDVIVATNGYTGKAIPWLRRRVVPFSAYMIATEELSEEQLHRVFPNNRTVHDFNNNLVYMRRAPDAARVLIGARTGPRSKDLKREAAHLQATLCGIFPELGNVRISRVWTGQGGGTFDLYPHLGVHDGVHHALGYCFAGVPMGTYLGEKAAWRVLGDSRAATVFADRPFPTKFWYHGNPWFVPLLMSWYDHLDRRSGD